MKRGFGFCWWAGQQPKLILPCGRELELGIMNDVPYLTVEQENMALASEVQNCSEPSFKQACRDLLRELETVTVPKGYSRTNLQDGSSDGEIRSMLLGAYTRRGTGIARRTLTHRHLVDQIHALARHRSSCTPYLAMQINNYKSVPAHTDRFNHSLSWVIALGDFRGGRLWIADPEGTSPCPHPTPESVG
eukprot:6478734-Amphidinium_carterae.1